ncbi:MAG TPA: ATP-dependent metallopeptidase FtsH/Yme1/Tma family protein, partial [Chloroflexota bacterium]|nr:ATP-dependent metallopeptidase FtsH/Yme1/Tma family protein [Chloroflexota bacterium]
MNEPSSPVRKSRDSASQPPAPRQQLPGRRDDASGGDRPPPQRFRISGRTYLILLAAFALVNAFFYTEQAINNFRSQSPQIRITQSELIGQAKAGNVKSASLGENGISGDFKRPFTVGKTHYKRYTAPMLPELVAPTNAVLESHGVRVSIVPSVTPIWVTLLSYLFTSLPLLLLLGLILYGTRAARSQTQGIFGFGQSRGKLYTEERPHTTFGDVAGVDAAKAELREIVDFLKEPAKYHRLGARIPKGVLLVGPPGTGKTLLARAVAGEANVPFLAISATEFVELFVGVGASRVRDLFERAKASAPSIVFIDEMDAIGGHRGARGPVGGGSNDEREQTLNQMLVSMDGFEPNDAVIVLGATNRPDVLDRALLRPGRFDRQVVVDPPDRKGREAILKIHTAKIPLGPDVDLAALAGMTPGMSGADLANLANEAALSAARSGESQVTQRDFTLALDRITLGLEGSPLMIEEERRLVAFHEGGHALVAFMLPNVDPVNRITITP